MSQERNCSTCDHWIVDRQGFKRGVCTSLARKPDFSDPTWSAYTVDSDSCEYHLDFEVAQRNRQRFRDWKRKPA